MLVSSPVTTSADLAVCAPDDPRWMHLFQEDQAATAFHHPAWAGVVRDTYGFPAAVLGQLGSDGRLVAGIPAVQVRDLFGRRRWVSLPFTDHCAPLLEDGADPARFAEAIRLWQRNARQPSLEVRAEIPGDGRNHVTVGTRHLLGLEADAQAVLRRLHKNRIQRRIRRSRELGVGVVLSRSRVELDSFYRLHCETRRRQGVPVQPRRFIESIWERLIEPGLGFVVTARLDGKPVASALFLAWNRHLIYKYGASDSAHWKLGANFLVHWTAMEWGCANGFRTYDFGRTDAGHESLRAFKAGWGAEEVPLTYTHLGASGPKAGRGRAGQALSQVIKRSPTAVCRALGEMLYRYAA